MATATGSRHSVSVSREASYGVLAGSPVFTLYPHTTMSLGETADPIVSNELAEDRNVQGFQLGNKSISGDLATLLRPRMFYDLWQALFFNNIVDADNTLTNGVVPISLAIERRFTAINVFELFRGCMVNTLTLAGPQGQALTASWGIIGREYESSATTVAAPTVVANTGDFITTFNATLFIDDVAVTSANNLTLNFDNGLAGLYTWGSDTIDEIVPGQFGVTGSFDAYFRDSVFKELFRERVPFALRVNMTDAPVGGNEIVITLPQCRFTQANTPVSDAGAIMQNMAFQAYRSPTLGYTARVVLPDLTPGP
jgi:hypothetical protein